MPIEDGIFDNVDISESSSDIESESFGVSEPTQESGGLSIGGSTESEAFKNQLWSISPLVSLAATDVIKPDATLMNIVGSGGAVTLTKNPTIIDGINGQVLILRGNDDTNTVTLTDGNGMRLQGNIVLEANDTITLIYDAIVTNDWIEISRDLAGTGASADRRALQAVCFNFTTSVSTGDGKFYMHIDQRIGGMDLVDVHAEVITAGTTGTTDIQIANVTQAVDMLSTKLTVDSGETGSDTAATPAVINTSNDGVTLNDVLRIDVDAISTTAPKGLIVTLGFA